MDFKERGWSGPANANRVKATVTCGGTPKYKIEGRFNESLNLINLETGEVQEGIWRMNPKPENHEWMYQFSWFTL